MVDLKGLTTHLTQLPHYSSNNGFCTQVLPAPFLQTPVHVLSKYVQAEELTHLTFHLSIWSSHSALVLN